VAGVWELVLEGWDGVLEEGWNTVGEMEGFGDL